MQFKTMRRLLIAILIFVPFTTFPTDFEASVRFGNRFFATDRAPGAGQPLGESLSFELDIRLIRELSSGIALDMLVERDAVLGNSAVAQIRVSEGPFLLGIGPGFGLFNRLDDWIRPGFTAMLQIDIGDVAFVGADLRESLGGGNDSYSHGRIGAEAGFYVYNAVVKGFVDSNRYTDSVDDGRISRRLTSYGVEADVFKDGVPYGLLFRLAYESQAVSRTDSSNDATEGIGAVLVGADVSLRPLSSSWTTSLFFETYLFTFGTGELAGAAQPAGPLYTAGLGVTF